MMKIIKICVVFAIFTSALAEQNSDKDSTGKSEAFDFALTYIRKLQGIEYSATKQSILSETFILANSLSPAEKKITETEIVRLGRDSMFFCDSSTLNADNNQIFGAISAWDGFDYQVYRKDSKLLSVGKKFKTNNAFIAGKIWALLPVWWVQPHVFFGEPPDATFDFRTDSAGMIKFDLPENARATTGPDGLLKQIDFDWRSNNETFNVSVSFERDEQSRILPVEIIRKKNGRILDKMEMNWSYHLKSSIQSESLVFPSKITLTEFDESGQEQVNSEYNFQKPIKFEKGFCQFRIPESLADLISDEETRKTRVIRRGSKE